MESLKMVVEFAGLCVTSKKKHDLTRFPIVKPLINN